MLTFTDLNAGPAGSAAELTVKWYSDGTPSILIPSEWRECGQRNKVQLAIGWTFEADRWEKELFVLQCVMAEIAPFTETTLLMPYVPNARMDRVPAEKRDAFTLKTFAKLINGMGFDSVVVVDPHSDVTPALIDRCTAMKPWPWINWLEANTDRPVWVFPDAGAMHRYGDMIPAGEDRTFGRKIRDWDTQYIKGYTLMNGDMLFDRNVVIVDDIIAHGYTLLFLLKEIERYHPRSVKIFATHVEDSFVDGELYKELCSGELKAEVYTTDSIVRKRTQEETMADGPAVIRLRIKEEKE